MSQIDLAGIERTSGRFRSSMADGNRGDQEERLLVVPCDLPSWGYHVVLLRHGMGTGAGTRHDWPTEFARCRHAAARLDWQYCTIRCPRLLRCPSAGEDAPRRSTWTLYSSSARKWRSVPGGTGTQQRAQAVQERMQKLGEMTTALRKDAREVSAGAIDALLALYDEGFIKLARAQDGHVVFQTASAIPPVFPMPWTLGRWDSSSHSGPVGGGSRGACSGQSTICRGFRLSRIFGRGGD